MIPTDILIDKLEGHVRGEHPAIYLLDDLIFWNESKSKFVLIYTIYEHSMMNPAGCIAWGVNENGNHRVIRNPKDFIVQCSGSPSCHWLNDDVFIVKLGVYHPDRKSGQKMRVPLVAIDFNIGCHIIDGTDHNESRVTDNVTYSSIYNHFSVSEVVNEIKRNP